MPTLIYKINKGINQPVCFKGLKAQYIWYLGGGVAGLLILFAIFYIIGVNSFICLGFVFITGSILCIQVYKLSNSYGEFGMMKKIAKRNIPKAIKSHNRKIFLNLNIK